jgi:aconitate hydratase
VIAGSIARIHGENLVNYGVLPLTFEDADDGKRLKVGDVVEIRDIRALLNGDGVSLHAKVGAKTIGLRLAISRRQRVVLLAGGAVSWMREKLRFA